MAVGQRAGDVGSHAAVGGGHGEGPGCLEVQGAWRRADRQLQGEPIRAGFQPARGRGTIVERELDLCGRSAGPAGIFHDDFEPRGFGGGGQGDVRGGLGPAVLVDALRGQPRRADGAEIVAQRKRGRDFDQIELSSDWTIVTRRQGCRGRDESARGSAPGGQD